MDRFLKAACVIFLITASGNGYADYRPFATFFDCAHCPEMVVMPTGSFVMGSPASDRDRRPEEGPQVEIRIGEPFALGKYEVTRGQFAAYLAATGQSDAARPGCEIYDAVVGAWRNGHGATWRAPGFEQTQHDPVVCVSWDQAQAYAAWLARETGLPYRLPSEAEWEFAARGFTTTRFWWGDRVDLRCACANGYDRTSNAAKRWPWPAMQCDDGYVHTAPVGSFAANPFGLHDVSGNVAEWVADGWHESYAGRPATGASWPDGHPRLRTVRGGSWLYGAPGLRVAMRMANWHDQASYGIGFRIARSL